MTANSFAMEEWQKFRRPGLHLKLTLVYLCINQERGWGTHPSIGVAVPTKESFCQQSSSCLGRWHWYPDNIPPVGVCCVYARRLWWHSLCNVDISIVKVATGFLVCLFLFSTLLPAPPLPNDSYHADRRQKSLKHRVGDKKSSIHSNKSFYSHVVMLTCGVSGHNSIKLNTLNNIGVKFTPVQRADGKLKDHLHLA